MHIDTPNHLSSSSETFEEMCVGVMPGIATGVGKIPSCYSYTYDKSHEDTAFPRFSTTWPAHELVGYGGWFTQHTMLSHSVPHSSPSFCTPNMRQKTGSNAHAWHEPNTGIYRIIESMFLS